MRELECRPKILAVDDQSFNLKIIVDIFKADFEVFIATSGRQAIEKAGQVLPDIILLDIKMPDVSGYDVCQQLKADPISSRIPIIFLTSQHDEADEVEGFMLGASDFISKPINAIIVRARVEAHLTAKLQSDYLKRVALVDQLTGVGNRRKYEEEIRRCWNICWREHMPLAVLLLDIDHFKKYNDHYGHQGGDECLATVAGAIQTSLKRPLDSVSRYGGEEFVCILPFTPLEGASQLGESVCEGVRKLGLVHAESVVGIVTVSIGISAVVPVSEEGHLALIELADSQLYQAKRLGRDRCCAAPYVTATLG